MPLWKQRNDEVKLARSVLLVSGSSRQRRCSESLRQAGTSLLQLTTYSCTEIDWAATNRLQLLPSWRIPASSSQTLISQSLRTISSR